MHGNTDVTQSLPPSTGGGCSSLSGKAGLYLGCKIQDCKIKDDVLTFFSKALPLRVGTTGVLICTFFFCSIFPWNILAADDAGAVQEAWVPTVWHEFLRDGPTDGRLPDFSRAGYAMGDRPIPDVTGPVFDVTAPEYGALADDDGDDTTAIQAAIDAAGAAGGGVVFLPAGRYDIHSQQDKPFIIISHHNIVLRGSGCHAAGTVLHLGAPGPEKRVRRLGTVPAVEEARSSTIIAVMGPETTRELAQYTGSAIRGQTILSVSDSSHLVEGQPVRIQYTDPLIDTLRPDPRKVEIAAQLTHPFNLLDHQKDSFGNMVRTLYRIVRIEKILDGKTIRLASPARFNEWIRYQPRLFSFEGVRGVGIEHLRLESSWPGDYRHHKPHLAKDGTVLRTAKEQDYLWGGLWFSHAVDGWVRNVVIKDLTQGIIFSHCADFTVRDIRFQGLSGHAGVTIAQSHGVLVERVDFVSRLVHPISLKMWASGNVITDCVTHYEGWNADDGTDAAIDFHGQFPYENLFDDLRGFYVCPGGDLSVLPHAGVRNVFWHIRAPERMECFTCGKNAEFARTYDHESTSSGTPETMFEHLPQAFFIGLYRKGDRLVEVGGSAKDTRNTWMTREGLNRPGLAIPSLYKAQRDRREWGGLSSFNMPSGGKPGKE